jgi:HK97 family phage portal protein
MIGTAYNRNVLHRLGDAWQALKQAPPPAQLYAQQQGVPTSYLSFPGWAAIERDTGGQDEKRAKTAIQSAWVYRNINAIAKEISVAELIVKTLTKDEDEDVDNHPLELLWERPNPYMGRSFLMQFWAWQLLLDGEGYFYLCPVGGDRYELWPVPSFAMQPVPHPREFIAHYLFKTPTMEKAVRIDKQYIIYSRLPNPFDIRRGLSPLVAAMIEIEGDLAMARWNKNFFAKENAAPTGLISMPKDSLDTDIARVRMEIQDFFGSNGARRVAVARAGDLTWEPFDRSQKDMEFLLGRQFTSKLIDTVFGIPEGFWSKDATRANSEGAKATMIENAVWPHLVMLAEDLTTQAGLLLAEDERATFDDIRPRNRSLELEEFKTYQAVRTVNELRAMIGDEPIGEEQEKKGADPRGYMLVAEITKGMPLPATEASTMTEEYLAEQEAAAEEEEPTDDAMVDEGAADATDAGMLPEAEGEPMPEPAKSVRADPRADERHKWERKALKALKRFGRAAVPFAPAHLSVDEHMRITEALKAAQSAEDVRAAFKAADDTDALITGEWAAAEAWAVQAQEGE